jgi:hypothetical protein
MLTGLPQLLILPSLKIWILKSVLFYNDVKNVLSAIIKQYVVYLQNKWQVLCSWRSAMTAFAKEEQENETLSHFTNCDELFIEWTYHFYVSLVFYVKN